jgi:hypothetical protein
LTQRWSYIKIKTGFITDTIFKKRLLWKYQRNVRYLQWPYRDI